MNVEVRKNLIDILQAAEEIQGFMKGMDFQARLFMKTRRIDKMTKQWRLLLALVLALLVTVAGPVIAGADLSLDQQL